MSALDRLAAELAAFGDVRLHEPMHRHTTFGIGGPADVFVTLRDVEGLAGASNATRQAEVEVFVLGSGSNILVADGGIRGVVLDNRARAEAVSGEAGFRVASGASLAAFSRRMCRRGLDGLTWAVGIPGTFGGAVVYNAGAYGGCLADILTRVRLLDAAGRDHWLDAKDLGLVYRGSVLTRGQLARQTVLECEVVLAPGATAEIMNRVAALDQRRLAAQPRGRNAGSMFKNPPESPAWKLVEAVGLRGARRGDAAISDRHCNFFVNEGAASAADVSSLVEEAERRVKEQFGVALEREVAFVGAW